jgi:predicted phosphodiesterase
MGIYKDEFIAKHGEIAYAEKLLMNAKWRKKNPEAMETYKRERSKNSSEKDKRVLLISDIHIGSQTTDVEEIKMLAKKYWRGIPIILLGDLIDAGIDRGMQFNNSYDPQDSVDIVKEIFQPLNIIGYLLGNHEQRVSKTVGIDVYRHIFNMEKATTVTVNDREIYFSHGRSTAENMFLEFQKIVKWCSADLVGMGHSHDLARITFMRGEKIQHLVRTGSFIGREQYAVDNNYAPKIRGWCDFDTVANFVHLKAINDETGEIYDI